MTIFKTTVKLRILGHLFKNKKEDPLTTEKEKIN